jgi:putative MATE family efflux protein
MSAAAIAVNTWIGLAASILGFACATPLLRLMQLPEALMVHAHPFLVLLGGTLFLEAMNTSLGAALRAHGHVRDAMIVTLLQNVINVIGNCVLLFGLFGAPPMGVTGVALASVFSRVFASIALWVLLDRRLRLRLRTRDFVAVRPAPVRRILHIGLPAAGEHLSYWLTVMVITSFVARLGTDSLAALTYTRQVTLLVILFTVAIGLGTEIYIGRMIGAGEFEGAYREVLRSVRWGIVIAGVLGVLVAALAAPLLGIFSHRADIVAAGALLLRLTVVYEPGRVLNIVVINALRATGDARFPVMVAAVSQWCVCVPLCWLIGLKLGGGLTGIWITLLFEEWIRGLIMYRRWKSRRWLPHAHRSRDAVSAGRALPLAPEV